MRIGFRHFFGNAPADGIDGDQPVTQSLRLFALPAVILFQDFQAHLSALGEPGENDPAAFVFMIKIPAEGGGNILIGDLPGLIPLCPRQTVCVDRHLTIIRRKQTPCFLVYTLFQIESIDEITFEFVIEIKRVCFASCVHSRTNQEDIDIPVLTHFKVCPIVRYAVIQSGICFRLQILLFGLGNTVCVDPGKVIFHGDRDKSLCSVIRRLCLPILSAPFPDIIIRNDHIRLRRIRIPAVDRIIHHAGITTAVAKCQDRPLTDLSFDIDGFITVKVLLDKTSGNDQLITVLIFEIHIRRDRFVSHLFDFEICTYHMVGCDVIPVGRISDNRPGSGPLGTADHINCEAIFIQILNQLHHRKIGVVDIPHVVKACRMLLSKLDCVLIELLHGHSCVRFRKVSCQVLIRCISGSDGGGYLLQFVRYPFWMIDQTIFDEHHRIVIGIVRLAGQRPVHIKYCNTVFLGNEVGFILRIGHLFYIIS